MPGAKKALGYNLLDLNQKDVVRVQSDSSHEEILLRSAISRLLTEIAELRHHQESVYNSISMRLTWPLRFGKSLVKNGTNKKITSKFLQTGIAICRQYGLRSAYRWARQNLENSVRLAKTGGKDFTKLRHHEKCVAFYRQDVVPNHSIIKPSIIIIADQGISACTKYRVTQRKEHLEKIGWQVCVIDAFREQDLVTPLLSATIVVFYRLTFSPLIERAMAYARHLGIPTYWEVDDLIFDRESYEQNGNLLSLPLPERAFYLEESDRHRASLIYAGHGIASTRALADFMLAAGAEAAHVIENALDHETMVVAKDILGKPLVRTSGHGPIWLCFGTGSRARNADFRVAEGAILRAMANEPRLHVHLVGNLSPSSAFFDYGERFRVSRETSFSQYLHHLGAADFTISPLEKTHFNDCKSVIKFMEAGILGIPTISSPTRSICEVVEDGVNGLLADTEKAWYEAIMLLSADPEKRSQIGAAARHTVETEFSTDHIINHQVLKLFGEPPVFKKNKPRILSASVFYAPQSFGGAALLVEALQPYLRERGFDLSIFTTKAKIGGDEGHVTRYDVDGMPVIAVPAEPCLWTSNVKIGDVFGQWLDAWSADIVHLHAIQTMGLDLALQCRARGIPYIVTLHDCWWMSENIFITDDHGRYHFKQPRKTPPLSRYDRFISARRDLAYEILMHAAALLAPSESHKCAFVRNGIPEEKIIVNNNGFFPPKRAHRRREVGSPLRMGYVGGIAPAKGWGILRTALNDLKSSNWSCRIVDSSTNLGLVSIRAGDFSSQGEIIILPGYKTENVDDFFDEIDVLLFPSQWEESFGLTVREALARDVWVISTAPGGQSEAIVEGVNGNLIPMGENPKPLIDAMQKLIDNPSRFDFYVNPLKHELHFLDDQADEIKKVYEGCLLK